MIALAVSVGGAAEAARPQSMFTPTQERRVLEGIQEACNNTWCEGDFVYEFKRFHCEKWVCTLDLNIISYGEYDDNGQPNPATAKHHPTVCTYTPVRRLSDVLKTNKVYVTPKYFLSLAKCFDDAAEKIGDESKPQPTDPNAPVTPEPPKEPDVPIPLPVEANEQTQPAPESQGIDSVFRVLVPSFEP